MNSKITDRELQVDKRHRPRQFKAIPVPVTEYQAGYFNRDSDGQLYEIVETIDSQYMVLVNGCQWSQLGNYDASGAGDSVFNTAKEAEKAFEAVEFTNPDER